MFGMETCVPCIPKRDKGKEKRSSIAEDKDLCMGSGG